AALLHVKNSKRAAKLAVFRNRPHEKFLQVWRSYHTKWPVLVRIAGYVLVVSEISHVPGVRATKDAGLPVPRLGGVPFKNPGVGIDAHVEPVADKGHSLRLPGTFKAGRFA